MMSLEEKRDYLNRYRLQQAKIKRLNEQSVINIDRKSFYEKEILKAKRIRNAIEDGIESLENETEIEILAQKYLCGKSLEETAEMLNYSKRQIERLHLKALEHLNLQGETNYGQGNTSLRS
jgi:DNA-directed RNA polymerase specialized sigma subunit